MYQNTIVTLLYFIFVIRYKKNLIFLVLKNKTKKQATDKRAFMILIIFEIVVSILSIKK